MKRDYHNNVGFQDILFNFLLGTVILLVIAVLHIVTQQNEADIKTKAEFVITLEWTGYQNNDIDIWIRDPLKRLLWYRQQEIGVMHADRDDKGWTDDVMEGGEIIRINQEIVTIRGKVEGEWIINLHLYRIGDGDQDKERTDVIITFIKLNPKASIVFKKEYVMNEHWKQITVARFYMTEQGEILDLTDMPEIDLIEDRVKRPVTGRVTHPTATDHDNDVEYIGP